MTKYTFENEMGEKLETTSLNGTLLNSSFFSGEYFTMTTRKGDVTGYRYFTTFSKLKHFIIGGLKP